MADGSITFALDGRLETDFKKICVMNGITMTDFLRSHVESYVNHHRGALEYIENNILDE